MEHSITLRLDIRLALDCTIPPVEGGLKEGLITEEEAGELLTEAILSTLEAIDGQ